MTHHVLLVPGFFAFEALGEIRYFAGVAQALERAYAERGQRVTVHEVPTPPTASIRQRAARLVDELDRIARAEDGARIHLVGHSTGGLDARLAIAPTADLPTARSTREAYREAASVVTLATPHGGTPLASFFASVAGKPLLNVLTAMAAVILERGELPTRIGLKALELLTRVDELIGSKTSPLDELYEGLLRELTPERRERVVALLRDIEEDTSLIFQLTPEGVDLLDAATGDPETIPCGSVVTRAKRPGLGAVRASGRNVVGQVLQGTYALLSTLAAHAQPEGHSAARRAGLLEAVMDEPPEPKDSDGVVPTRSQPWGEILSVVSADHLDVVGHYGDPELNTADWLPSDSGYDRAAFARTWDEIAAFQLDR
jgi:pimeloyl-ACP methyl ester carboxylesterase